MKLKERHKDLIEETINSYLKKHNLKMEGYFIYKGDLAIYEIPADCYKIKEGYLLAFLEGYNAAMEVKE